MSTFYLTPYTNRKEDLFDNIFNDLFISGFGGGKSYNRPNIKETDELVILSIDFPGFEKSDINIDYKDNQLYIQAKSDERSEINHQYTVRNINIKKSSAELKNGVLELTLEKEGTAKKQILKIS
jgi:HSP20 family protein